jgi:hypothetical protein
VGTEEDESDVSDDNGEKSASSFYNE